MPDIVPGLALPAVPEVLPLVDVPDVEPVADPVLELVPYGSDEGLLLVALELPIVTLVRMNSDSDDDELRSDMLPVALPLVLGAALPDVPTEPAWLAGVTQPVSVTVFQFLSLLSLFCSYWLDVLGLVWPLVVDCAAAGLAASTAVARIPITY